MPISKAVGRVASIKAITATALRRRLGCTPTAFLCHRSSGGVLDSAFGLTTVIIPRKNAGRPWRSDQNASASRNASASKRLYRSEICS